MINILTEGSKSLGLGINSKQLDMLDRYAQLLVEWNKKINLTAITDPEGIAVKHFLDSMSALCTGNVGKNVIDVGTGAGFPGLVLKIMKPEIELTLLDSLNKRINFLKAVCSELGLDGVDFVHARAEDGGADRAYRARFDTVVSRAVANMTTLSEWCIPFLRQNGHFLALKGPLAMEELDAAKRSIAILGGKAEKVFETDIPFSELHRKIIIVKKVRQTPIRFPRKPALAAKMSVEQCYNLRK